MRFTYNILFWGLVLCSVNIAECFRDVNVCYFCIPAVVASRYLLFVHQIDQIIMITTKQDCEPILTFVSKN